MLGDGSEPPLTLDDQLCFALYAATSAIVRAYGPHLREHGLDYEQYLVMLVLWQNGSRTAREIASRLDLRPHAVAAPLDALEKAGLVRRVRNLASQGVARVSLTEDGEALESTIAAVQHQVRCETGLDSARIAALRNELLKLTERLRTDARERDVCDLTAKVVTATR